MTLASFLSLWAIHLAAVMSPGPAFVMCLRTAASEGFRPAVALSFGLAMGVVVWTVVAMTGLAVLFHLAPWLFTTFKIVGAAFLLWIAVQMWRHARQPLPVLDPGIPAMGLGKAMWTGFLTNVVNPKTAVFFAAVFVGFLPTDTPLWQRGAIVGLFFADEFLWDVLVAKVFSLTPARTAYARLKTGVDRIFGTVIACLGLKIALT